ncbi:MAG: hydroxymethylbilane synthase [Flavitalea sp.]
MFAQASGALARAHRTRQESRLALWQASEVQRLLAAHGFPSELTPIKSEGDIDLTTPLYEMGIQGIFTRSLDIALLENRIDIAVHSMKDVPTQLPAGIIQAAVLKRGAVSDLLAFKTDSSFLNDPSYIANIATSSIRRKAQWLHRYPNHQIHNLRGNMQTRLQKLTSEPWDAAIFAQAGLERIDLRPENSITLDWMLPAPAQGAIMIVCRSGDPHAYEACRYFNDDTTEMCTAIERAFLRGLLGGCSTPVSALSILQNDTIHFKGNILSPEGQKIVQIEKTATLKDADQLGQKAAAELLANGGQEIARLIQLQSKTLS